MVGARLPIRSHSRGLLSAGSIPSEDGVVTSGSPRAPPLPRMEGSGTHGSREPSASSSQHASTAIGTAADVRCLRLRPDRGCQQAAENCGAHGGCPRDLVEVSGAKRQHLAEVVATPCPDVVYELGDTKDALSRLFEAREACQVDDDLLSLLGRSEIQSLCEQPVRRGSVDLREVAEALERDLALSALVASHRRWLESTAARVGGSP